jgi:nucleotide-binding universal stress UspA family protein
MTTNTRPVVVGVDGLPGSAGALRYAVAEAGRRGAPLHLVHVVPSLLSLGPAVPMADLQQTGVDLLHEAEQTVRQQAPALEVATVLTRGERTTGVVKAAEDAQLLVVGRESRRGIERMLTGTATAGIATHAGCDVVVVPSFWVDADRRGLVVVGIKHGRDTHELLARAFAEAATRGATLRMVNAWHVSDPYFDTIEFRTHSEDWQNHGIQLLHEISTEARADYPDVPVEARVVHGRPARVLLQESAGSDLLVISRRRLALPPYGQLGGVGHDVLRLSDVPVQVVPYVHDPARQGELVLEEAGAALK